MATNKLVFKKIRAKNFRSIGNSFIELDYMAPTTLIASKDNGSGKSTLSIWALYYVLFGKGFAKGVKIASLTNSRSNKELMVELEFTTKGSEWLLRRGMKPGILEIYQDGKLVENEAALSDIQAYIQSVIGMDEKSFCSIVALGVDRFVPFVQMSSPERRAFVEQMLDLIVISDMNARTKDRIKDNKKKVDQVNYDIGLMESKYSGRSRTLTILEDKKRQRLSESGSELQTLVDESIKQGKMLEMTKRKLEELESKIVADADTKLNSVNSMIMRFNSKMEVIKKNASSVTHLDDCPTCKQKVSNDHKSEIENNAKAELDTLIGPMIKLEAEKVKAAAVVQANAEVQRSINDVRVIKGQLDTKIHGIEGSIRNIRQKMVDSGEDALIFEEQGEIEKLKLDITKKTSELETLRNVETKHLQMLQILKDDGMKASIVAQYIPTLNQNINNTLDQMNLYVQINIDSEFNVTMFAPDRKGQTIENLSTGQLRRVDLAVLLAWRDIAKRKASVDCNLLALDEILENLSASGVGEFMEMWEKMGSETNLIVISQRRDEFEQYFGRVIEYKLVNDMTVEA